MYWKNYSIDGLGCGFLKVQVAEGQGEGLGARHLPPRAVDAAGLPLESFGRSARYLYYY